MKQIEIVLATYNGDPYLGEQLRSLQAQTCTDWHLRVRDDGSLDSTLDILDRFARTDGRIAVIEPDRERLGACGSFARLLATSEADYVLFCDQDDLWLPQKLEANLEAMRVAEQRFGAEPLLVHSDLAVVDSEAKLIHPSFWAYQALDPARCQLHQLLVQNNVTGCTLMVNRALKELAVPIPEQAVMHDWWLALVASAFGRVIPIPVPLVRYRQHRSNRLGAKKFGFTQIVRQVRPGLQSMRESILRTVWQAQVFVERYAERLSPELYSVASEYARLLEGGVLARRRTILSRRFFKHRLARTLGLLLSV